MIDTLQELLALGERIGSVNTGLSNNTISSCLSETTYYHPLYQTDEQRKCAICLVKILLPLNHIIICK